MNSTGSELFEKPNIFVKKRSYHNHKTKYRRCPYFLLSTKKYQKCSIISTFLLYPTIDGGGPVPSSFSHALESKPTTLLKLKH